ncbi:hypothetical protein GYA54_03305 [Candidatus Kuenenbacteria bacterium]|nr:hypothetical protein [Candidatus Kuenenbacteria bacterium]
MQKNNLIKNQRGGMLIMALVFTTLFTVVAIGIAGIISSQHKLGLKKINWQKALAAAEAGVNYYRWHLIHAPSDYQDGTGEEGPYIHDYKDNLGNVVGKYELNITAPEVDCSNAVTIESTGYMDNDPDVKRKIRVKYGKQSLSTYAFLTNSNAWFGENETLHGPVHSNGGIRMDGQNDNTTSSRKETYICGSEHGCTQSNCNTLAPDCSWVNPDGCTCSGVWGEGGDKNLWQYPGDNVDFNAMTIDLRNLMTLSQTVSCAPKADCYWPQRGLGYHFVFKDNGTFDVYRVTKVENPVWGYDGNGWIRDTDDFEREEFEGNYAIPNNCGIIFVEDDVWVNGVIKGRTTLASAKFPESGKTTKIRINGNLTYVSRDNTNTLGLVSQSDIIIPLYAAPDVLEIDAAMLAQKGRIYRKHYCYGNGCARPVPANARNYISRNNITIYGSIITNNIWTWSWVDAGGNTVSGYRNTETIYDPNLNYNPPPSFPTTGEYRFLKWEEVTEK